jgi:hypothetical protein
MARGTGSSHRFAAAINCALGISVPYTALNPHVSLARKSAMQSAAFSVYPLLPVWRV